MHRFCSVACFTRSWQSVSNIERHAVQSHNKRKTKKEKYQLMDGLSLSLSPYAPFRCAKTQTKRYRMEKNMAKQRFFFFRSTFILNQTRFSNRLNSYCVRSSVFSDGFAAFSFSFFASIFSHLYIVHHCNAHTFNESQRCCCCRFCSHSFYTSVLSASRSLDDTFHSSNLLRKLFSF